MMAGAAARPRWGVVATARAPRPARERAWWVHPLAWLLSYLLLLLRLESGSDVCVQVGSMWVDTRPSRSIQSTHVNGMQPLDLWWWLGGPNAAWVSYYGASNMATDTTMQVGG